MIYAYDNLYKYICNGFEIKYDILGWYIQNA